MIEVGNFLLGRYGFASSDELVNNHDKRLLIQGGFLLMSCNQRS